MAITSARFGGTIHASARDASPSTAARMYAIHSGTTPAAMGRYRLVGCARSASTSRTSLTRYTADAASENATKAMETLIATSRQSYDTLPPSAATGAISTSKFFTHWRGLAALIRPVTTLRGGPLTGAGSSLRFAALSALLSLEMLMSLLRPGPR